VTRAQAVFSVALGLVTLLVTVVGAYVLTSARRKATTTYRGAPGQWAFFAHRVSGFLVFAFLLLHIVDVSLVRWPELYDQVHALYGNVLLRVFEVGLLFALLFHAFNGLRIIAVDFFPRAVPNERRLLTAAVGLTMAAGIHSAVVIMWPFVEGRI
jgi:succinate dehydrogenase / fumarate reductase, cytochrome b subunit